MKTVRQLISILESLDERDKDLPITVLYWDGAELPFRQNGPIVTKEGGGASPPYYAINVTES